MEPLSPVAAAAGGLLIGSAAALFLLLTGRIAGVSGMVASATRIGTGGTPRAQASAFILGLVLGTALVATFVRTPEIGVTSSVPLLVIAGLLVGFGTRLGNGCTSGHGVCGMARLSPRSFAATATFMVAAIATLSVMRHVVGG
ncbi:YeeE/YedE family protein [Sphingomonas xanthus]|uniref:YeeE/YedE family protein n=1 Tax=Sphingomonas xanthus TaxID=2594473 RepID=A0A516INZ9_9SPHN|nr:YeeE/YedE thiosulfate transporter family protein [Sphingomonas xanthus]QDP18504.1 YeeE/YedE family protein [Sphingomonas xanthus]